MHFTTKLLHGKAVGPYADNAVLPPIAQVTAFAYESAEQQEDVRCDEAPPVRDDLIEDFTQALT